MQRKQISANTDKSENAHSPVPAPPSPSSEAPIWFVAVGVVSFALLARFGVMESPTWARVCVDTLPLSGTQAWVCAFKNALPLLFIHDRLSGLAFLCGLLAWVAILKERTGAARVMAWLAWAGGLAGALLYGTDYGVPAALFGLSALLFHTSSSRSV